MFPAISLLPAMKLWTDPVGKHYIPLMPLYCEGALLQTHPSLLQSHKRLLRAWATEEHAGRGARKGRPAALPTSTEFILKPCWPRSCSPAAKSSIRKKVVCWQIGVHPLLEQKALILGPVGTAEMKKNSLKMRPLAVLRSREWFFSTA